MKLATVLCSIDFSGVSEQEIHIAAEVCEAFGARLILHHNLSGVSPGFSKAWEWDEVHRGGDKGRSQAQGRLQALLDKLPKQFAAEGTISSGPLGAVLLQLTEALPADLLVLGSHGWSTADHASVTERLIERSPCPVLTLQETEAPPAQPFRLHSPEGEAAVEIIVATDFSGSGQRAAEYAFDLARALPDLHLHLLHAVEHSPTQGTVDLARRRLEAMPPADLGDRIACHIEHGRAEDEIMKYIDRVAPSFMIVGTHAGGFFHRLFSHDTARQLLHRAKCPVWFVPPKS